MKILFVLGYPRAASYVLPAIERLARTEDVYVFRYRQMASHETWSHEQVDLRPILRRRLDRAGVADLGEPTLPHHMHRDTYSAEFEAAIQGLDLDVAVFDESYGKENWGGSVFFYRALQRRGIPCIACQEGATENDRVGLKRIAWNLGLSYDYCFCFGGFDEERLLRNNPHLESRLFAVGIPANDELAPLRERDPASKGHLLLVPSYTRTSGPSAIFEPLTDDIIEAAGVFELAEREGLDLVIKEKGKRFSTECAFSHLAGPGVRVTFDERDLDRLVGESRYVIGAPSTLLFKPVQLGIPTAVLGEPYMGRRGFFGEFPGLTDSSRAEVFATLEAQEREGGVGPALIERAVTGGSTFSSTDRFDKALRGVAADGSTYEGPVMLERFAPKERFFFRFPALYKGVQYPYSGFRRLIGKG